MLFYKQWIVTHATGECNKRKFKTASSLSTLKKSEGIHLGQSGQGMSDEASYIHLTIALV